MILNIVFIVLFILIASLFLFFLFNVLFPAMKSQSFNVKSPVFSDMELHYILPSDEEKNPEGKRAIVLCSAERKFKSERFEGNVLRSCALVNAVYESVNDCKFSCIGLGDCTLACPQEAIVLNNRTAVVTNLCCGCGKCISSCPKHLITLVPKDTKQFMPCSSPENTLTTCSECRKEKNLTIPERKGFKIWQSCYRIFDR